MRKYFFLIALVVLVQASVHAQENKATSAEDAYTNTINQRADKIVATLDIPKSKKASKVSKIISDQYRNLNNIQTLRDEQIKVVKQQITGNKEAQAAAVKTIEDRAKLSVDSLHKKYLKSLCHKLSNSQVDKVKDGMTYGVLPITYKGYNSMLPNLTEVQKKQIMDWLVEARENAMDAESSEKKHWWFGKYKGRINNYLSSQGIDMNKASKEWQERIKAEQSTGSKN